VRLETWTDDEAEARLLAQNCRRSKPAPCITRGQCRRRICAWPLAARASMTRAGLQQLIRETRAALETPINFADLERRGVLRRAKDGWFVLLQPKAMPTYAWQQVTRVRASTHAHPMVKFNEPDEDPQ
jgi:hypothetical protein